MEIDITNFVRNTEMYDLSASRLERGDNAGPETWANAKEHAADAPLIVTERGYDDLRAWIGEFGAWDEEEIANMDHIALNALLMQFIAGDIRTAEDLCRSDTSDDGFIDWEAYEKLSQEGTVSGRAFKGVDGRLYYSLD